MKRHTGLKPSWAKPAKTPREDPVSAETRALVAARSGGFCELGCGERATALHHRLLRRHGDHRACTLLAVCGFDHRRIHGHVQESYDAGWLVRADGSDPATVPVVVSGGFVLLGADGKYRECSESTTAARREEDA